MECSIFHNRQNYDQPVCHGMDLPLLDQAIRPLKKNHRRSSVKGFGNTLTKAYSAHYGHKNFLPTFLDNKLSTKL